jgi:hypothetical protein
VHKHDKRCVFQGAGDSASCSPSGIRCCAGARAARGSRGEAALGHGGRPKDEVERCRPLMEAIGRARRYFLGFENKSQCERYRAAMKAENVPASLPEGSAILLVQPHVEHKRTVHPAWPSFTSERRRTIQCGAACCPRTLGILTVSRGFAGSDFYGERHGRHRRRDPEGLSTNCASLAVSGPAHRRPTFGGTLLGAQ